MNSLFPNLDKLYPTLIGFDDIFDMMVAAQKDVTKNIPKYPPYNIKQVDENKYVIEMAVAGFAQSDIEISMAGNKLVIKGDAKEDQDTNYIFKGIAKRAFEHQFKLNDTIEIKEAELVNGMLRVWLDNLVKAQDMVKRIGINVPSDSKAKSKETKESKVSKETIDA